MSAESGIIAWQSPPKPGPRKADVVAAALRAKPGEWALIHQAPCLTLFAWWGPLIADDNFEVKTVYKGVFPGFDTPRDTYARFVGVTS